MAKVARKDHQICLEFPKYFQYTDSAHYIAAYALKNRPCPLEPRFEIHRMSWCTHPIFPSECEGPTGYCIPMGMFEKISSQIPKFHHLPKHVYLVRSLEALTKHRHHNRWI